MASLINSANVLLVVTAEADSQSRLLIIIIIIIIIIIMLPNQAIASTPSAPRPSGAEGVTPAE
jgi:hypothetical protein